MFLAVLVFAVTSAASVEAVLTGSGVPAAEVVVPFAGSPALDAFARDEAGQGTPEARAVRLFDAVMRLVRDGRIVPDRDNEPKSRTPKTAGELFGVAVQPGGGVDRSAGCYEFTVLYVALARAAGLDVVGAERVAALETGQIGHVMAALRDGERTRRVVDLQNGTADSRVEVRLLDDLELAAHHYSHLAVSAFLGGELRRALTQVDLALRLAPNEAGFLSNRATVLAAQGEHALAVAEAVAAVQSAPRVPLYRYGLGRILLESGEVAGARRSLEEAVRLHPAYGLARRDLGWSALLLGDVVTARRELEAALRAGAPQSAVYLGLLQLSRGEAALALATARAAEHGGAGDAALRVLVDLASGRASRPADTQERARLEEVLASVSVKR